MGARVDRTRLLGGRIDQATRARRARAIDAFEAALDAVEPERATAACLRGVDVGDDPVVFAVGKASVPMARAALDLGARRGVVVALSPAPLGPLQLYVGSHPEPAPDAARVGEAVRARARALGAEDVALCLVSGGGSAMLELPRRGIRLAELTRWTSRLARAGADIGELNAVRRAWSRLKGGGLAAAMAPARIVNVVLSDVPGWPPEVVASGPTCAPPAGPDPARVARRYSLWDDLSARARELLSQAPASTAPEAAPEAAPMEVLVAADNDTARAACGLPDRGVILRGEAREVGARFSREAPGAWVAGGETTVTVRGPGRGGRSLELALGAVAAGWTEGALLAAGTDGVDGSSDFAGALIDEAALREASRLGLSAEAHLAANDAAAYFEALGTGVRCGPTGTNVADLCLRLAPRG